MIFLKLLKKPTKKEINVFSKYKYEKIIVLVHQDKNLCQKIKMFGHLGMY